MKIQNFKDIKNVLYINLEHRNDRKEHFENEIKKINLNYTRFNAIKNENGEVGCLLSHIECLKIAIKNNYEHILILEDDVVFNNPELLISQFDNFIKKQENWDVILFGGNNVTKPKEKDECYIKVNAVASTVAYLVNGHYFEKLLENFQKSLEIKKPVDIGWEALQWADNWYLIIPLSVSQKIDYSDIQKRVVNYDNCLLKIKYEDI